jgi:hypothetical protein
MKKEYINPEMLVVTLHQQCQILAGSGVQSLSIPGDENITLDDDGIEDNIDDV